MSEIRGQPHTDAESRAAAVNLARLVTLGITFTDRQWATATG